MKSGAIAPANRPDGHGGSPGKRGTRPKGKREFKRAVTISSGPDPKNTGLSCRPSKTVAGEPARGAAGMFARRAWMEVREVNVDNSLILRAASFAADRHRDQWRKGVSRTPFINHPIAVAHLLCEEGRVGDPEILAAALLHDTIEDTPTRYEDISEEFGDRVARLVAEVSDDKRLPKAERKLRQVAHAGEASRDAQQIKIADKICNLREILASPPADWSDTRKGEYFEWAKSVVDGMRGANAELEVKFDAVYFVGQRQCGSGS